MRKTDVLIIGTGIAGLSLAVKLAQSRKDLGITIMTKDSADSSNTQFAQGGIAAVMDNVRDSFAQHVEDTLKSGAGSCDEEIVRMVVRQAPDRLQELISLGVSFDKINSGWDLALEGGHSQRRILHHADITGREIERVLLKAARTLPNITILEQHFVIDLFVDSDNKHKACHGAFYIDESKKVRYIRARAIVLSTGGCGQIFRKTTNSHVATGDGVAIAHRAGAQIADMQYIQFHPTAFYEPGKNPYFLLTEALRGAGAHIVNEQGKRFLFQYDLRGELATRDIVSKAISTELQRSGRDHVLLDCTHLGQKVFEEHFPAILGYCKSKGLDPVHGLIPITPVAHYQCGGVTVNRYGQTTVNGLYAIGECARTGLHGKNRLASNSLLEAVVFAHQASYHIGNTIDDIAFSSKVYISKYSGLAAKTDNRKISALRKELRAIMGFVNIDDGSENKNAFQQVRQLKEMAAQLNDSEDISVPLAELINMLTVASLILEHAKNNLLTIKMK